MKIKKMKIFLVFSIITMLVLPTTQIEAVDVDINEENVTNVESTNKIGRNINRDGIIYEIRDGIATVTDYIGESRVITIPSRVPDYPSAVPVRAIGDSAFDTKRIQEVEFELPSSLITIGDKAFRYNDLTSVIIPNSVTSIGNHAFTLNLLTSVTIPNSVTSIGDSAFNINQLLSVTIPNSVTSIGERAFLGNLLTSLEIPNSLTSIARGTFEYNDLTSVSIPDSVTSIGESAFNENRLSSVELPNSVTSIGIRAFRNNDLTSVIIPNSVRSIGNDAFINNELTSVTIPNSVTSIGDSAFRNNNLTSVTIPNSVTSIGYRAFRNNQLTSVNIPNPVTSIGNEVFSENPLQYIHTNDGNADNLKSKLSDMGNIRADSTMLLERSPTRYESDVEMVNNVFTGSDLQFRTISQIKHVYNNNSRTWSTHVPVVQWYRNTSPIAGETNATLTLSNIQASDAGVYHAVVDSTVLENITVNVTVVSPISELFPDANLAKAIAEELHKNEDISALVSLEDLATIENINLNGKGIQDLTGIEHLINVLSLNLNNNKIQNVNRLSNLNRLQFLLLNHNLISDISSLSALTNLFVLEAQNQTITLPEGKRGEPTELQLKNRDGSTPAITFVEGKGTYENGKLIWTTAGENRLTWSGPQFSGTVTQSVIEIGVPISTFFPDENLAKVIAQQLNSNNDISALTTETELAKIDTLFIQNSNIKDLSGIENLKNLSILNAFGNHINDISITSKLSNLSIYNFGNQTITLPEGKCGEPIELQLINRDGSTPAITFVEGQGTYENGKLIWTTAGENRLTWSGPQFSGTVTQSVIEIGVPISNFFPDENLAKAIAQQLNSNNDISALTTETELAKIDTLFIQNSNIKDLSGIENLKNLSILNASGNHINDISITSKLSNLSIYNFGNQTITLPEVELGIPTALTILDQNGKTPNTTITAGTGNYENGQLTWSTVGENRLHWASGAFSGTVTQYVNAPLGQPISKVFTDENLAKAIAKQLHGNEDISVIVTDDELLTISRLEIPQRGIKNISGIERLTNLEVLNINHNHIHDISALSELPKLMIFMAYGQDITLPEVTVGTPTKLTIRNEKGETPNHTFTVGQGMYADDTLIWTTVGENKLTWDNWSLVGSFTGTIIQRVASNTISDMFPDANFAQSIAMELHGNTDTSVEVTEQDLARITQLTIPNRNIRSISGIENLQNLMFISAEGNQITDISMLSKLPKLVTYYMPKQSVILSDVVTGTPTPLTLLNHNAIVPQYEFIVGNGSYNNGMLTWTSAGENKLNWTNNVQSDGFFYGTIIQNVF